jgi:glycosyltransferase involved in cell wall biosynthesis
MKILVLCNKSPYPPKEGGPIAMNAVIEGLIRKGHQVKVLTANTNKYFVDLSEIPLDYRNKTGIESVYIDLSIKPVEAFLNLFSKKSYHVQRFISREFEQKLVEILTNDSFDIIQIEMLYLAPYVKVIRKYSKAKIILRAHNIEHRIWERIAANEKNSVRRIYLNHLFRTLKNYELNALNLFDGIVAITNNDAGFFRSTGTPVPVTAIPFGIQIRKEDRPADEDPGPVSLFHLGAMNWYPNMEGIRWFLDKVWPMVHKEFPSLRFYLAGRNTPEWMFNMRIPGVEVVGEVEDAVAFMRSKTIMVVPLFSGSGIRIKIIEGMSAGKTIISTHVGAEGIHCTHGVHILLAETPEEFLERIRFCVNNPESCRQLGKNASELIDNEHDNNKLMDRLITFYRSVLTK